MAASWPDATSTPAAGTGQRSSIARVRSNDQAREAPASSAVSLPTGRKSRCGMFAPSSEGWTASRSVRGRPAWGGSRRCFQSSTCGHRADERSLGGRGPRVQPGEQREAAASYATDGVDGSTFGAPADGQGIPQEAGLRQRLPRGLQQEAERQEMQVAGMRRVGARVEMIEVGEPRRLASDEALLEVRAAGVASWDEFVRTGGWDVGGGPPMALGVEAAGTVLAADQAVSDRAPGDAVMTHPVPLRDQGTLGAPADRPGRAARPQAARCQLGGSGRLPGTRDHRQTSSRRRAQHPCR